MLASARYAQFKYMQAWDDWDTEDGHGRSCVVTLLPDSGLPGRSKSLMARPCASKKGSMQVSCACTSAQVHNCAFTQACIKLQVWHSLMQAAFTDVLCSVSYVVLMQLAGIWLRMSLAHDVLGLRRPWITTSLLTLSLAYNILRFLCPWLTMSRASKLKCDMYLALCCKTGNGEPT
eukprot:scaffold89789_cov18-Tisochrysis_lutea.AAC.2